MHSSVGTGKFSLNGAEWKSDSHLFALSTAENCLQMLKTSEHQHFEMQDSLVLSEKVMGAVYRFDLPKEIPFFEHEARDRIRNEVVEWLGSESVSAKVTESISILQKDVFPSNNEDLVVISSWSGLMVELAFAGYSQEMQYVSDVISNLLLYGRGGGTQSAAQKLLMAIDVQNLASKVNMRKYVPPVTDSGAPSADHSRITQLLRQIVSADGDESLPEGFAANDLQTLSEVTAGAYWTLRKAVEYKNKDAASVFLQVMTEMSRLVAPTAEPTADLQKLLEISSLASLCEAAKIEALRGNRNLIDNRILIKHVCRIVSTVEMSNINSWILAPIAAAVALSFRIDKGTTYRHISLDNLLSTAAPSNAGFWALADLALEVMDHRHSQTESEDGDSIPDLYADVIRRAKRKLRTELPQTRALSVAGGYCALLSICIPHRSDYQRSTLSEIPKHERDELMHLAVTKGFSFVTAHLISIFGELTSREAVKSINETGQTPLHVACINRAPPQLFALLWPLRPDVNARCDNGKTPLTYCFPAQLQTPEYSAAMYSIVDRYGLPTTVPRDMRTPVDLWTGTQWWLGRTAWFETRSWDLRVLILQLLSQNADVRVQDNEGLTPIHTGFVNGWRENAALVVEGCARLWPDRFVECRNLKDDTGRRYMDYADFPSLYGEGEPDALEVASLDLCSSVAEAPLGVIEDTNEVIEDSRSSLPSEKTERQEMQPQDGFDGGGAEKEDDMPLSRPSSMSAGVENPVFKIPKKITHVPESREMLFPALGPDFVPAWASLSNLGHLCRLCEATLNTINDAENEKPNYVWNQENAPTLRELRTTAYGGCHFCTLVLSRMIVARQIVHTGSERAFRRSVGIANLMNQTLLEENDRIFLETDQNFPHKKLRGVVKSCVPKNEDMSPSRTVGSASEDSDIWEFAEQLVKYASEGVRFDFAFRLKMTADLGAPRWSRALGSPRTERWPGTRGNESDSTDSDYAYYVRRWNKMRSRVKPDANAKQEHSPRAPISRKEGRASWASKPRTSSSSSGESSRNVQDPYLDNRFPPPPANHVSQTGPSSESDWGYDSGSDNSCLSGSPLRIQRTQEMPSSFDLARSRRQAARREAIRNDQKRRLAGRNTSEQEVFGWPTLEGSGQQHIHGLVNVETLKRLKTTPASINVTASAEAIAKFWLEDCECHHEYCKGSDATDEIPRLPTPVIYLGPCDENKEPVLLATNGQPGRYATLSYRWGQCEIPKTASDNMAHRHHSLPLDLMPRTFQDAVNMTKALGLEYLWIDALCIVQDDQDDLMRELFMLPQIYANCAVTLVAVGSMDAQSGCRPNRNKLSMVDCPLADGISVEADSRERNDLLYSGSVHERGWCFQEISLSTRLLFCGAHQLFWQCRLGIRRESEPTVIKPVPVRADREQSGKRKATRAAYLGRSRRLFDYIGTITSAYSVWYDAVTRYSRLGLTFPSDKLLAISALSQQFAGFATKVMKSEDYACGLWRTNFTQGLLWAVKSQATKPRPPYRCPSWSWAACDEAVTASLVGIPDDRVISFARFLQDGIDHPVGDEYSHLGGLVEVLDVSVEPVSALNPFGAVKSGKVTIYTGVAGIPEEFYGRYFYYEDPPELAGQEEVNAGLEEGRPGPLSQDGEKVSYEDRKRYCDSDESDESDESDHNGHTADLPPFNTRSGSGDHRDRDRGNISGRESLDEADLPFGYMPPPPDPRSRNDNDNKTQSEYYGGGGQWRNTPFYIHWDYADIVPQMGNKMLALNLYMGLLLEPVHKPYPTPHHAGGVGTSGILGGTYRRIGVWNTASSMVPRNEQEARMANAAINFVDSLDWRGEIVTII